MENLTPKTDNALGAVIRMLGLEEKDGFFPTMWGKKTEHGLKLSILNVLRDYGVVLAEEEDASV